MEHPEMIDQLAAAADRLAAAAETLDRVLGKLDAQQEALNAKVDRIVAAVEEHEIHADADPALSLSEALSNREIVDDAKFRAGLGKMIDGAVECLNASAWAKQESAAK